MGDNKTGIDDQYLHIQQSGVLNSETELLNMIKAGAVPYLSPNQISDILSWTNARLMDAMGDNAVKEIVFSERVVLALAMSSETEVQRWIRRFEDKGARGFKRDLKKLITEKRKEINLPFTGPTGLGDAFSTDDDFPVEAEELQIPPKWQITASGVFQEKETRMTLELVEIAFFPIFIIRRMVPMEVNSDGGELLDLAYKIDGHWKRVNIARGALAEARKLVPALTEAGVPINATTAAGLVKFFGDYEKANRRKMPVTYFTETMGWKGGSRAFVVGNEVFGEKSKVVFHTRDADILSLVNAVKASGTPDGWRDAVKIATLNRPKLVFNISLACVPPLLQILNCANFFGDKPGRSSRGKTSADRVAISTWGDPGRDKSLVRSMNFTKYAIENLASAFNGVPIVLDESHFLAQAGTLGDIVYLLGNGTGRSRGAKTGGNQRTKSWRTVVLSNGESSLEMASSWTGLRGRVLTLRNVWEKATGNEVRSAVNAVCENHGHVAPELIKYLIQYKSSWPTFKRKYNDLVNSLSSYCKGVEVAERRCEYFAATLFAAGLVDALFDMGWNSREILTTGKMPDFFGQLFEEITMLNSNVTMGKLGLDVIRDWILTNRASFEGGGADFKRGQKVFGKWRDGEYVGVYGSLIRQELKIHGINDVAVVDELKEKGICSRRSVRLVREQTPRTMLVFDWGGLMSDEDVDGEVLSTSPGEDEDDVPY
ncbi:MAG: DUF927 domain-containing protein [Desulfocucumaceae bacterium]